MGGSGKQKFKKQPHNKPKGKKNKKNEGFVCFVCRVTGHKASKCRDCKDKGHPCQQKGHKVEANVALTSPSSDGYVPQASMANSSFDCWIDTGATKHICADRSCLSSFQGEGGGFVLMGNGVATTVREIG